MSIKFLKIRDVKSPSRANSSDAGIDFYIPKFTEQFKSDLIAKNEFLIVESEIHKGTFTQKVFGNPFKIDDKTNEFYFELKPLERILIPSGIKYKMEHKAFNHNKNVVDLEYNRALIAFNKSGVTTKLGLISGACVCDMNYQGEVHINLINVSNDVVKIYENQKIIQFIEMPVYTSAIEFVENEDELFYGIKTDRGEKGFGAHNNI